jgi:hypothetical protein
VKGPYYPVAGVVEGGVSVFVSPAPALPKILNMTVPQVGHLPLMALRPFFMVSSTPLAISFLALHLTQYPSAIKIFTIRASCPNGSYSLTNALAERNREKDTIKHCYRITYTNMPVGKWGLSGLEGALGASGPGL